MESSKLCIFAFFCFMRVKMFRCMLLVQSLKKCVSADVDFKYYLTLDHCHTALDYTSCTGGSGPSLHALPCDFFIADYSNPAHVLPEVIEIVFLTGRRLVPMSC